MSASKVRWPELSQLSLCSEFDKENSMEFSLISLPTYTLYYCGYALILPWSSCYSSHVTPCDCDMWHDHLWPSVTPIVTLWQSHMILSHAPPCSCKSKEKEKEKKRNINNDLAILPSHDTAGESVAPSLGVITETWPHKRVVSSRILVLFLGINLMLCSIVSWYTQRSDSYLLRSCLD